MVLVVTENLQLMMVYLSSLNSDRKFAKPDLN